MEDIRMSIIRTVTEHGNMVIDENPSSWTVKMRGTILDSVYYIICSYIRKERDDDKDWGMGMLERRYLCSDDFLNAVDEMVWIEENREIYDNGLIIHIFDNVYDMTPGKHRRALLYLLNMLYFDL